MKKSVTLRIDQDEECVVAYDENTMVTFQIGYNPHHEKADDCEYSYYCHGFEWGDKTYSIDFIRGELSEGQKIEIEFGSDKEETVIPDKSLVKDEKRCGFCNKLNTEVDILIEKNFFNRICNVCVQECVKVINDKGT